MSPEFEKYLFKKDMDMYYRYMEYKSKLLQLTLKPKPIVIDNEGKLLEIFGQDMAIDPDKTVYAYREWDEKTNMFVMRVENG